MEGTIAKKWIVLVAVISLAVLTKETYAQEAPTSQPSLPCITALGGCAPFYANTTLTPTSDCCNPLANVLRTQVMCLCQVFNNPAIQKQLGINLKAGLELFARCNITGASTDMCTASPPGSPPAAPKSSPSPSGAVNGVRWIGFSGFFAVLLFVFSLMG